MNNIKRVICAFLALVLMLGMLSCKKNEEADDANTEVSEIPDISFLDYTLIRPENASDVLISETAVLYSSLLLKSGKRNIYETDFLKDGETPDPQAKEILVGITNRAETEQAIAELTDQEFVIAVIGNKIVITGLTDTTTLSAISYFVENFLSSDSDGTIAGDFYLKRTADVLLLTKDGKLNCSLVAPDGDYAAMTAMNKVSSTLRAISGQSVKKTDDSVECDPESYQIVFGYSRYDCTAAVAEVTAPEGYTVDFIDNQIVVFAWTSSSLLEAAEKLIGLIGNSYYVDENGLFTVCIAKNKISSDKGAAVFYKDIPFEAKGEKAQKIYDAGDNTMMLYWADATAESFTDYSDKIKALGYATYQTNENTSIKSVTYMKGDVMVHVYYYPRLSELRAVVSKGLEVATNPYEYTKVCEPAVTQISLVHKNYSSGASYLIRLEDGTFIVIDGGYALEENVTELYRLMQEQKPDEVEDIIITAWIISHPHMDHYDMYDYYAKSEYRELVTVRYLIGSDFSDYLTTVVDNPGRAFRYSAWASRMPGCKYIKMHTGQKFYFPGITIDVLFTHEDIAPGYMYELNNALDTVFMLTVNGNTERKDYKFLMINDFTEEGSDAVAAAWGNELKCDVVQLGHHTGGGSVALYEFADAPLCLCTDHERGYTEGWGHDTAAAIWAKENMEWILEHEGNYTFWFD